MTNKKSPEEIANDIVAELWDGHCAHDARNWKSDCETCTKAEIVKQLQQFPSPAVLVMEELVKILEGIRDGRWTGRTEENEYIKSVLAKVERLQTMEIPNVQELLLCADRLEAGALICLNPKGSSYRKVGKVAAFLKELAEIF